MKNAKSTNQRAVLILSAHRITARDKERFGFYYYEKQNWEVITWSLGDLLGRRNALNYKILAKEILHGKFDITIDNALTTRSHGYYWEKVFLLMLLKLRSHRVIFGCGLLPEIIERRSGKGRLRSLLATPVRFFLNMPWMLLRANACVAGGENKKTGFFYKHEIKGNSYDFDRYLEHEKQQGISFQSNNGHGLYLEQGMHDCMDHRLMNRPYPIDREMMLREIANGLNELREKAAIRIVVKKHPRTDRCDLDLIGLREDKRETTDAVRESSYVVAHYTTAVSFAVIHRKPIIFWVTKEQLKAENDPYINNGIKIGCEMAKLLGSQLVIWPARLSDVDMTKALRVDEDKYKEYEKNYIRCSGALEVTNAEKVIAFYIPRLGKGRM